MKFTNKQILFGIIFLAFLLRFFGIFDGLPAVYNSTEYYHAKYAMSMGARQSLDPQISNYDIFNPRLYIYPMFYQYLTLVEYVLIYLVGNLFSVFKNSYDFAIQFLISPSIFYLVSRLVNVIISLFTILVIYKKLINIFTKQIGLIASAIFSFSYYMILASQQAVSDAWLIFFCTLSTLYFLDFLESPNRKKMFLASIFTGFAIGTKYNAGVLLILFMYVIWSERKWFLNNNIKIALYSVFTIVGSFLIVNPYWILRFPQFMEGLLLVKSQANEVSAFQRGINYIWEFWEIVKFELVVGIGFFVSTVYYIFKRNKYTLMMIIMIVITFVYVGSWQKKGIDYLYPIFPSFIIVFSLFANELIIKLKNKNITINTILLLVFFPSIFMGIYHIILKLNPDTREQATEWIVENVSKDEKICYDNYHYDLGLFDLNRYTKYGAGSSQIPEQLKNNLLDYRNDPKNVKFNPIVYKAEYQTRENENLFKQEQLMYKRKILEQLINEKTKYFISNNWFYQPYFEVNPNDFSDITNEEISEIQNTYKKLKKDYNPVKIFKPNFWENGPELVIYKLY